MAALKLTLLGRPQILLDDQPIPDLNSSKAQALLFYLAVTRQRHSRQALAGLLWPEKTEARARNNLRVEITRLRRFLAGFLDIRRPSLQLKSASELSCDVTEFLKLVEAPQPTLRQLQTAVDLYHGDFLEDFNLPDALLFEEWAQERRAYFREQVLEALYEITEYHSQQKNYRSGIEMARRLLGLEPWLEKAHRQLMWMLAKSGDRAAALAQYESCYELLEEELGVEPEAETVELYEQIKSGEIVPDDDYSQTEVVIAPPFQVPKLTENFVGRRRDMAWLLDKLTGSEDDESVAVVGMGGMGKTTLAIAVCHALRDEFVDGVLWANVTSSDPAAILEDWAQAFGYDFSRLPDVESRAAAFRGVVAEKKVLMVLDDVMSLARIRPLLLHSRSVKVLITTREAELAYNLGDQIRELVQLSSAQAGQLLAQIVGSERITEEPEAAQAICDLLQNLPLAVEIVAQRLRLFRSMTLAEMADRLRNEQQRLAELELSDQAVQASFAISYRALDSYEKRAFALMGVFNGRSFPREAFAAVAELDYFTAGDRLFSLEGASLVQMGEDGRFQQHSLLADFARERLAESEEGGYGRFAHHYLYFAQQNQHNYDALRPEWDNMMAAMGTAHTHHLWQTVFDFADTLHDAWFVRGRFTEARLAFKWVSEAASITNNTEQLAYSYLVWGQACIEQGDLVEARQAYTRSLSLYTALNNLSGIANVHYDLARIELECSDYAAAESLLDKSLAAKQTLQDTVGIAKVTERQARVRYRQWKYQEAHQLGQRALNMLASVGNKSALIPILRLLVDTELQIHEDNPSKLDQAERYCKQAIELSLEFQEQTELAAAFYGLSRVKLAQGDLTQAYKAAIESLKMLERIGDRRSRAIVLSFVARIEYGQKDYEAALDIGKKSLQIFKELGDRSELATGYYNIGLWYKHLGDFRQAQEAWDKALAVAVELDHKRLIEYIQNHPFI